MKFQATASRDRQGVQTLSRITANTTLQMQNLLPRCLFLGGGAAIALLKGVLVWRGELLSYETFCIVTGVTLMLLGAFGERINAWNAWRLARRQSGEVTLIFEEERFCLRREGKTEPHPYDSLHAVFQTQDAFAVYLSAKEGYLLRHSDFTEGDPRLLADFLEKYWHDHVELLDGKTCKRI